MPAVPPFRDETETARQPVDVSDKKEISALRDSRFSLRFSTYESNAARDRSAQTASANSVRDACAPHNHSKSCIESETSGHHPEDLPQMLLPSPDFRRSHDTNQPGKSRFRRHHEHFQKKDRPAHFDHTRYTANKSALPIPPRAHEQQAAHAQQNPPSAKRNSPPEISEPPFPIRPQNFPPQNQDQPPRTAKKSPRRPSLPINRKPPGSASNHPPFAPKLSPPPPAPLFSPAPSVPGFQPPKAIGRPPIDGAFFEIRIHKRPQLFWARQAQAALLQEQAAKRAVHLFHPNSDFPAPKVQPADADNRSKSNAIDNP